MTVKEFIGTLESSDRLRIIEGKAEVYVGYLAAFKPFADHEISEEYRKYSGHEVKKFRAVPEITHRRWKELGLMKPLWIYGTWHTLRTGKSIISAKSIPR